MVRLLGTTGVADIGGEALHVQVVGESDAGRLVVQEVGGMERHVIQRRAFVSQLAIKPVPISDEVRTAALSLGQAIEHAKAMCENGSILSQDDYRLLKDELEEEDHYPFAAALVESGVHVKTGAVDLLTDPHENPDPRSKRVDEVDRPGDVGEAEGAAFDAPDQPGAFPWTPGDAGDGISNESAHTEFDWPGERTRASRDASGHLCDKCDKPKWECSGHDDEPDPDDLVKEGQAEQAHIGPCDRCQENWPLTEDPLHWGRWLCPRCYARAPKTLDPCRECGAPSVRTVDGEPFCGQHGVSVPLPGYPEKDEEHEAEMGWSGAELVNERWAGPSPSARSALAADLRRRGFEPACCPGLSEGRGRWVPVATDDEAEPIGPFDGRLAMGMGDLLQHPRKRPKNRLETKKPKAPAVAKPSKVGGPQGRDPALNPSVHEEINEAYTSENQWEDPDLHLGRQVEAEPYEQGVPLAVDESPFDRDDPAGDNIQPTAQAIEFCRHGVDAFCTACAREARLAQAIGTAGDAHEIEGVGDGVDAAQEGDEQEPQTFGISFGAALGMGDVFHEAQALDNRMMDESVHTNVSEEMNDRGIARAPEDEPLQYTKAPGPAR